MRHPFLVGPSVYLRPLEPEDAVAMATWINDPEVTRTLDAHRPISLQSEREFIERMARSEHDLVLGIVVKASDCFIGVSGLHRIEWRTRQASFGINIGAKQHWGRGYGTQATALVTGHAFETLNLNRVWLHVYEYNPAGIKAYERAGYRREGVLRQGTFRDGRYWDVHVMAMLRSDWDARPRSALQDDHLRESAGPKQRAPRRPKPRRVI